MKLSTAGWIALIIVAVIVGFSCQKAAYDDCRGQGHGRAYCWQITG